MTVSAIIPCYNAATTVKRAVDSLLQQTVTMDEIIVVNDGSTDGSLEILRQLEKANEQLIIIDQENAGVSCARNRAIAVAQGKFILTLDADDYFEPSFVEKALCKFAGNPDYGAVMCGYVRVVNGEKILPYVPEEVSLQSCLLNNGALSCLLFRKEAVLKAGGYDEVMVEGYEDWDLNIRILKEGYQFGIVNEVLFNYTDTINSRTYSATENDTALRLQMYKKYEFDYQKYGSYIFEELIRENLKLKTEKQKILHTTSFKIGHKITATVQGIINFFKNALSKR